MSLGILVLVTCGENPIRKKAFTVPENVVGLNYLQHLLLSMLLQELEASVELVNLYCNMNVILYRYNSLFDEDIELSVHGIVDHGDKLKPPSK